MKSKKAPPLSCSISLPMEPAEIAIVLARASDLHAKINDAIIRSSSLEQETAVAAEISSNHPGEDVGQQAIGEVATRSFPEAQSLRGILDALLVLEDLLQSLQALQKQQKVERDDVLTELEESRKILVGKLREYHGTEWEIVQEAHAFAGEPVQKKDDLLLPPYPSLLHEISSAAKHEQSATFHKRPLSMQARNSSRKASMANKLEEEGCSGQTQVETVSQQDAEKVALGSRKFSGGFGMGLANLIKGVGQAVGLTAKTALVIASVIAILTFSQLEPRLRRRAAEKASKFQSNGKGSNFQSSGQDNKSSSSTSRRPYIQDELCPPGKVLLVQDGVQKCYVKERIESPFKEVVKEPDVFYGFG